MSWRTRATGWTRSTFAGGSSDPRKGNHSRSTALPRTLTRRSSSSRTQSWGRSRRARPSGSGCGPQEGHQGRLEDSSLGRSLNRRLSSWANSTQDVWLCKGQRALQAREGLKLLAEDRISESPEIALCPDHALAYEQQRRSQGCKVQGCDCYRVKEVQGVRLCQAHADGKQSGPLRRPRKGAVVTCEEDDSEEPDLPRPCPEVGRASRTRTPSRTRRPRDGSEGSTGRPSRHPGEWELRRRKSPATRLLGAWQADGEGEGPRQGQAGPTPDDRGCRGRVFRGPSLQHPSQLGTPGFLGLSGEFLRVAVGGGLVQSVCCGQGLGLFGGRCPPDQGQRSAGAPSSRSPGNYANKLFVNRTGGSRA